MTIRREDWFYIGIFGAFAFLMGLLLVKGLTLSNRFDAELEDIHFGPPVWEVKCGDQKFLAQSVEISRHGTAIYGRGGERIAAFSAEVACSALRLRSVRG